METHRDELKRLRSYIADLEEELRQEKEARLPGVNLDWEVEEHIFGLPKKIAQMASAIYEANGVISKSALFDALYGHLTERDQPRSGLKILDVMMSRLRCEMANFNIEITTVFNVGFEMNQENKARYKEIINCSEQEAA